MPRKARIDAPGAIHHIICSDIEHREREIFRDDTDRDSFIERLERRYRLQMHGLDVDKVVDRVTEIFNLKTEEVLTSGKQPQRVKARSLLCYWVVKELGLSGAYMARRLKISKSAVSRAIVRGEKIATDMKLKLIDSENRTKSTPSLLYFYLSMELYLFRPKVFLNGRPVQTYQAISITWVAVQVMLTPGTNKVY